MRMIDTIRRAGRSLRQAKARTLLTSLAIAVGAFTITLSLAAGAGGRQYAADIIKSNTNVHELIVSPKQDQLGSSQPQEYTGGISRAAYGGRNIRLLSASDLTTISQLKGVSSVTPMYNVSILYITRMGQKKYEGSIAAYTSGISQQYAAGSGSNIDNNGIIVPDSYRQVLGFSNPTAAIGQQVSLAVSSNLTGTIHLYPLTIVGVVTKSALSITGSSNLEVSTKTLQAMYDYANQGTSLYGAFGSAIVIAANNTSSETVKQEIQAKGYSAETAQDLLGSIFQFINVLQGILVGFGILAVLASIFGIINTQYISVLERTQQIGLMKALGMRRRDVSRLFRYEAAWIGFLGGAIGAGLAIVLGTLLNPTITQLLTLSKGTNLLIFQPIPIAAIIIGLMVVSVGAGILPARKAAKLDPIEALRTE